jgi:ribonuclease HI
MELRALVEAVRMVDGPCAIVSDHGGIVRVAQEGRTPEWCKPVWQELYSAMEGKDVVFEWRGRNGSLGQRLAHQLAREAARKHGRP